MFPQKRQEATVGQQLPDARIVGYKPASTSTTRGEAFKGLILRRASQSCEAASLHAALPADKGGPAIALHLGSDELHELCIALLLPHRALRLHVTEPSSAGSRRPPAAASTQQPVSRYRQGSGASSARYVLASG